MSTGNGSKQLRRYNVRDERGRWLGLFVIGDDGFFATVSDYGNYAYAWTHAGCEFRSFLAGVDSAYLLGKLCGRPAEYDEDRTLAAVKDYIINSRRQGCLDKEEARKEWDLLMEHADLDSEWQFSRWLEDTEISDAYEYASYRYDSDALGFASTVWPAFVAMLRAELAAEKATTGEAVSS